MGNRLRLVWNKKKVTIPTANANFGNFPMVSWQLWWRVLWARCWTTTKKKKKNGKSKWLLFHPLVCNVKRQWRNFQTDRTDERKTKPKHTTILPPLPTRKKKMNTKNERKTRSQHWKSGSQCEWCVSPEQCLVFVFFYYYSSSCSGWLNRVSGVSQTPPPLFFY